MTSNDYYYGSADPYYNSNFLPNVSPSASSLDSGYCGPASVQSSIGNFELGEGDAGMENLLCERGRPLRGRGHAKSFKVQMYNLK